MLSENSKWRIRDSAMMLKIGIGTASEDLHLAENFEIIRECSSRNNALKRMK